MLALHEQKEDIGNKKMSAISREPLAWIFWHISGKCDRVEYDLCLNMKLSLVDLR